MTVHTFRDTFASRLVGAGYRLHKIKKLLGYITLVMTQKCAKFCEKAGAGELRRFWMGSWRMLLRWCIRHVTWFVAAGCALTLLFCVCCRFNSRSLH